VGNFEQMREVGIAGTAELVTVALRGYFIRAANHPGILGGPILPELFKQFVEANVELALGAVAMKMER
jgi:hypothetical protein